MTPAIEEASLRKLIYSVHSYKHDTAAPSYGAEAAAALGVDAGRVYKTLVLALDSGELVVAVAPVTTKVSLKQVAKVMAAKKAKMAPPDDVERVTGYVLGGVSPLGQKKRLRTVVDVSAQQHSTLFVSAGRRGLEIELCPQDLLHTLNAHCKAISE